MLRSNPKTTIAGFLLALGLALQGVVRVASSPWWVGLLGTALAVIAAAFLGKSARDDSDGKWLIRREVVVSGDPNRVAALEEAARKAAAAKDGAR